MIADCWALLRADPPRGMPCGLPVSRRLCTKKKRHPAKTPGVGFGGYSSCKVGPVNDRVATAVPGDVQMKSGP